ncbi:MAG: hypothetical protein CMI16_03215 [Opitutaceae bacterium]|nr:hypothetical protein [Opitutaceae bacterium]
MADCGQQQRVDGRRGAADHHLAQRPRLQHRVHHGRGLRRGRGLGLAPCAQLGNTALERKRH